MIDDDPTIRSLCTLALTNSGHEVVTAPDGRDGLSLLGRNAFDLVVTDLVMPEQEGISTSRSIRGMARDLPILAISGSSGAKARGGIERHSELQVVVPQQRLHRARELPRRERLAQRCLRAGPPPPAAA